MIKSIVIDGKNNYFRDPEGNIVDKYDPDKKLSVHITLEDSTLDADAECIKMIYGGSVIVQYGNDRFILDDGYQNTLIKAGYLVYKNYDVENEMDVSKGKEIQDKILSDIKKALSEVAKTRNGNIETVSDTEIELHIDEEKYSMIINIDTISGIVIKNKHRKDNSLPFYAFDKRIDKYGSLYLSIFSQNKVKELVPTNNIANSITLELLEQLGVDYHFVSQIIKKGTLYSRGL